MVVDLLVSALTYLTVNKYLKLRVGQAAAYKRGFAKGAENSRLALHHLEYVKHDLHGIFIPFIVFEEEWKK